MQSPKAGRKNGANMGRADWLDRSSMDYILAAMMPANRLVMECCIASGLRVSDVLSLKTDALARGQRMTVREQKTGKTRRIYWPARLYILVCLSRPGVWVLKAATTGANIERGLLSKGLAPRCSGLSRVRCY